MRERSAWIRYFLLATITSSSMRGSAFFASALIPRRSPTRAKSLAASKGFEIKASAPASSPARTFSSSARFVRRRTGIFSSLLSARMARQSSYPSISGIETSLMTSRGEFVPRCARAASPSEAAHTSKPASSSTREIRRDWVGLSSTTRMCLSIGCLPAGALERAAQIVQSDDCRGILVPFPCLQLFDAVHCVIESAKHRAGKPPVPVLELRKDALQRLAQGRDLALVDGPGRALQRVC